MECRETIAASDLVLMREPLATLIAYQMIDTRVRARVCVCVCASVCSCGAQVIVESADLLSI